MNPLRFSDMAAALLLAVLTIGAPLLFLTTLFGVADSDAGRTIVGVPVLVGWLSAWVLLAARR